MLVDKERGEYEIRAMYEDTVPLEESEEEIEKDEMDVFTSRDLRAKS